MHLKIYFDNNEDSFLLKLYGKYFLYDEMLNATQILAVYEEDRLLGLLIAKIKNEHKIYKSYTKKLYVNIFKFIQNTFFKGSAGEYDKANAEMLAKYKEANNPDGEIIFLASDPVNKVKGVGTLLLNEFEKREHGKTIYLYTDDMCTYQFYEHRGFTRVGEKDITLDLKEKVSMKCMLYSKKIS